VGGKTGPGCGGLARAVLVLRLLGARGDVPPNSLLMYFLWGGG